MKKHTSPRMRIRAGTTADLDLLETIEKRCYAPVRRSSRRSMRHSLQSPHQRVWFVETRQDGVAHPVGALILHHKPQSIRIHTLSVLPGWRGQGIGGRLIRHTIRQAAREGCGSVTLEADRRNRKLIQWYESYGFQTFHILSDYYSPGRDAERMRRTSRRKAKACLSAT